MSRLARPAARISTGSVTVARRLGERSTAWVRRGRRGDLTGWRASLGCALRLAVLLFGLYLLWRLVRAIPNIMWLLSTVWIVAAWRAGKPAVDGVATPAEPAPGPPPAEAVRGLLLDVMGDADGVHLRTVLAHLQEHGQWKDRTVTDLRARLAQLHIPHDRGVKVAGVPTWGVRRRDLESPSPAAAEETSTEASTAA
ncbi:hypothetical protein [Streptomyces sp. GbtcB6]|uniref:hypothetical protein n=1 Tax=Streptomyces sp. GbtcB6 TaxID=2824751 RepID=UPI001C310AAB|nr:hypothetical protein [Streptomyces sp. GbtcB6]